MVRIGSRSAHQSRACRATFKGNPIYRVSGMFHGPRECQTTANPARA
jgi:hypothetical protein